MKVDQLWRYPVKSMAGERVETTDIGPDGIAGDRRLLVVDRAGRVMTSRFRPKLLGLHASLDAAGQVLVDGRPWNSTEVEEAVVAAAGPGTRLVAYDGPERFDILPLLVTTDGAVATWGGDIRRLRPNIVVSGSEGWQEPDWQGQGIRINGELVVVMQSLRPRCVMTTFDPDTLQQDTNVLRDIMRRFHGVLCLNSAAVNHARVSVGDEVELVDLRVVDEAARRYVGRKTLPSVE